MISLKQQRQALLAQLVEHLTLNQGVQGSSPWRRTQALIHIGLVLFISNEVWLSLVERYVRDVEAASSNLVTSIKRVAKGRPF